MNATVWYFTIAGVLWPLFSYIVLRFDRGTETAGRVFDIDDLYLATVFGLLFTLIWPLAITGILVMIVVAIGMRHRFAFWGKKE